MTRRDAMITAALLAVACLVISVLVVTRRDPFSDPSTALEPDAPTPSLAGGGDDDELEAFVDEAVAFIEQVRDRVFLERPTIIVLSESEFVARLDADFVEQFDQSPEDVAMYNAQYRALGLIGPLESIDEVVRRFGEAGVLGFYDPATDELVVRERDGLSLLTKSTIVHELVHAFDDQHFDLDRPEYDDLTDEIPWTFSAIAEGSASWVEEEWRGDLSAAERSELQIEELAFGDLDILLAFELACLILEISPYEEGEPFVDHLFETGGNSAIDDALLEPPVSSEHVMEPSRFDADEPVDEVAVPQADGEVLWSGVGGQVLIDALFTGKFIVADIDWGGDQMVVWVDDIGGSCMRWDIRADTEAGGEAMAHGFNEWARLVGSARVEAVDGITLRIERCA
jgi:hypothetical protein